MRKKKKTPKNKSFPIIMKHRKSSKREKSFTLLSNSCLLSFSFSIEICQLFLYMRVLHDRKLPRMYPRIDAKIPNRMGAKICVIVPDRNFYWKLIWIDVVHSEYYRVKFPNHMEGVHNGMKKTKDRNRWWLFLQVSFVQDCRKCQKGESFKPTKLLTG